MRLHRWSRETRASALIAKPRVRGHRTWTEEELWEAPLLSPPAASQRASHAPFGAITLSPRGAARGVIDGARTSSSARGPSRSRCKRCVEPICRGAFQAGMTLACVNGIRQKIESG
jgi:hypothetical protein